MPDSLTDTSKVPQQRSTLCLPSLPTNLAESEGSPLIHASESALNQPLIKREHAEASSNIFTAPIHSSSQTKQEESGFICLYRPSPLTLPLRWLKSPRFGPVIHFTSTDSKYKANI